MPVSSDKYSEELNLVTLHAESLEDGYTPTVIEKFIKSGLFQRIYHSESAVLSLPTKTFVYAHLLAQAALHPELLDVQQR